MRNPFKYCNKCGKYITNMNQNEIDELNEQGAFVCSDCINEEMLDFKERESIAEDKMTTLNTPHYAVEVKETEQGIIIDVFHRHGDLIDSYTYWNDDVMEDKDE